MRRRVVITGIGTVSAFGVGIGTLWEGLCAGRCGLRPITRFDPSGFPCRLAGEVPDFSARDHVPKHYRKAVKVMARDTEIAVAGAKAAVDDARLATRGTLPEEAPADALTYRPERVGCQIGAGLIAAELDELSSALATASTGGEVDFASWGSRGIQNLQPLWMLKYLPNMLACHVTIIHGAEGPSNTITCGDASGALSLGESVRVIERGAADACFTGGAESKVSLMGILRLGFAGRLANTASVGDDSSVVRPYDPQSAGSIVGEGGGILIVEEHEAAARRGATPYAEVAGFGAAHSGPPMYGTSMPGRQLAPQGPNHGLRLAIERALADAKISASDIDVIVPMAAGSIAEDSAEAGALLAVFGTHLARTPMITLAPAIGHTAAGQASLQVAAAAMALRQQTLPARIHAGRCPPELNAGAAPSAPARLRHALVCTGSLGGQNAAIVLRHVS
jgi:3-oxoacyl-[acyl-carrier-protein] synthase II